MRDLHVHDEAGLTTAIAVTVLAVVLGATTVAGGLLYRTMHEAQSINDKAADIAATGRGINTATDAVLQLHRTDDIAGSILDTAAPLEDQLAQVVALAEEIDGLAASIDQNATAINSTAGTINDTAGGINSEAVAILDVARRIDVDVEQININLDDTIVIAEAILGDTNNVLAQAEAAHREAACIDDKLATGPNAGDGHC